MEGIIRLQKTSLVFINPMVERGEWIMLDFIFLSLICWDVLTEPTSKTMNLEGD